MTQGDLCTIKWWHIKKKCTIDLPGIYMGTKDYIENDGVILHLYCILITPPDSPDKIIITELTRKPVSCKNL